MPVRLDIKLDRSDKSQVVVRMGSGNDTLGFSLGEELTELQARRQAIMHIRLVLELLENSTPDENGWLGTVCDGWSMSPVCDGWSMSAKD